MSIRNYSNELKRAFCRRVCDENESTIRVAEDIGVPLKTVEKWVTAYNKDRTCYDLPTEAYKSAKTAYTHRYDDMSKEDLILELKHRDGVITGLEAQLKLYRREADPTVPKPLKPTLPTEKSVARRAKKARRQRAAKKPRRKKI